MAEEHLDVVIVGAGLSGIDAAYRLQEKQPNLRYAVLEGRGAVGGTWDLFRYPGIRSDSDMVTLGFPFRPWRQPRSIVSGEAIRDYIRETAELFGIDKHIRFRNRVTGANFSSTDARWTLEVEADGAQRTITCDFLFLCCGYYDYAAGHAPEWPGMAEFGGQVVHPQFWPDDLDASDKRVVVIGSGATAVTLVPALATRAAHVTMLQRSPTYVVAMPAHDTRAAALRRWLPRAAADAAVRWKNVAYSIFTYNYARKRPDRMRALIRAGVLKELGHDYEVDRHFNPKYDPWDQRLCLTPDGDLFEAIRDRRASIVTDTIDRFTPTGLRLNSGEELPADIVVTATGLVVKLMGGLALSVDGARVSQSGRMIYRGAMLEGVPNMAFAFGYTNASWTLKCDLTARFVAGLIARMRRRGEAAVTPVPSDPTMAREPMLAFSAGYVERAAAIMPVQGTRPPWRVHQNYALDLLDYLRSREGGDGELRFERRIPAEQAA